MSGEANSSELYDEIEKKITEYEEANGIPTITNPGSKDELQKYLTMNRDIIEKLSPQDCMEIAYRISQFSYYIQRLYNREQARIAWANACLTHIVAKEIDNYDQFMKHDIKVSLIAQQNSYANKLKKIANYAEQRALDLTFLSGSLKNLADIMLSNKYVKKNTE